MKILIYTDKNYEYQAKGLLDSLVLNGHGDIDVLYYTVGFDSELDGPNLVKKRWEIDPGLKRFPFYKPGICLDALLSFDEHILFLDSDVLISRRFNPEFFKHDYDHPMLSIGNWDLPFYYTMVDPSNFNVGDRVLINGDKRSELSGLFPNDMDCLGNISETLPEENSYMVLFDGKKEPLKLLYSELDNRRINDYSKLMQYYNIPLITNNYVYSCCISFNRKCEIFIREWKSITENEYLNYFDREYYPIAEETSMNITLWKNGVNRNYGRIFVNTLFFDVVKYVEENINIRNTNIFDNPLQKCEDSERVQFYHGMIDQEEINKSINHFKIKNEK